MTRLWHVSDDPAIERFVPRGEFVWAVAEPHVSKYWFPRDGPRGTWWAGPATTAADVDRLLDGNRELEVHAVQADWLSAMREARLVAYRLPPETFEPLDDPPFYFVSRRPVEPVERRELGDLLQLHAEAGIELRIVPDLAPVWARVTASTVEFSGNRLRNLAVDTP